VSPEEQRGWRRAGILGGTFNPPHLGHVELARHARAELELERVVLMPAYRAPHKRRELDPGAEHRLRMCALAVRDVAGVGVCSMEVRRGGRSYTVDTLRALSESHPDIQLTVVVGADMARTLPEWREPRELLALASLGVAGREGAGREQVLGALAGLDAEERVAFVEMPEVSISSSTVRERVARGMPVGDLVGGAVAGYISEQGLYRTSEGGER
jgi:nicotinate-nucleotide adenylyltransferase